MSNSPKPFEIPTSEQYEEAKKTLGWLANSIATSKRKQQQLVDELCEERNTEKTYLDCYNRNKEIVFLYETYKTIERQAK